MSVPPNQQPSELLEVFFESAAEILERLNRTGLVLEANPSDVENLRQVRRAVHTLKGDSAACGFRELSELAHRLEDVLAPEFAAKQPLKMAEIVLASVDSFQEMLTAYRNNAALPPTNSIREKIDAVLQQEGAGAASGTQTGPQWSEYDRLVIEEARGRGECVFQLGIELLPETHAVGFELARKALEGAGRLLALSPAEFQASNGSLVHAALSTSDSAARVRERCLVPSVVREITVEMLETPHPPGRDALQVLLEAEAAASAAPAGPAIQMVSEGSLRVEPGRIDSVMNLVGELIIGKSMLQRATDEFARRYAKDPLRGRLSDALAFQSRVLGELQKSVMKIRMVPVDHLFRRFPRIVRDVSRLRHKEIALELHGQSTDLDKSILDALAEPVGHLIRNAADHGIEAPAIRQAAGKSPRGVIGLSAYHEGDHVVIEVSDDGRGLDVERIVRRAVETGILTADEAKRMSEADAQQLIFRAGFSMADEITEISGRGVGLDVVKAVLDRLKGSIEVNSQVGRGTTFRLLVPLTLASIQALLFHAEEHLYAVPIASVVEITRVNAEQIHRIEGREVFQLRNQLLTLVRLEQLTTRERKEIPKRLFVVVIGLGTRRFGLAVDKLMGEEELVIKPLEDQLVASELVSGASILGDGTVVLILNISALVSHFTKSALARASV